MSSTDSVLTIEELAEREKVAPTTVKGWIRNNEAPRSYVIGRRTHRFRLSDVEAWERSREYRPDHDDVYGAWDDLWTTTGGVTPKAA